MSLFTSWYPRLSRHGNEHGSRWSHPLVSALVIAVLTYASRNNAVLAAEPQLPPITNGGFEEASAEGIPIDWETVGGKVTEDVVHAGRRSLALVHSSSERKTSFLNRYWKPKSGQRGAMLPVLTGRVSFWYRVLSASNARIWFGVIPMSADPWENTGESRTGITVPLSHIGDGNWHQAVVKYDYPEDGNVKWVHLSCFVSGEAADLRIDDVQWVRDEIALTQLDLQRTGDGAWQAATRLKNTGTLVYRGARVRLGLPSCLVPSGQESLEKTVYEDIAPGAEVGIAWSLSGTLTDGTELRVNARTSTCSTAVSRRVTLTGCVGEMQRIPFPDSENTPPNRPKPYSVPPTPDWFKNVTRVAYSDLGNTSHFADWPVKVIEDFGKAGVQVFYSRAHSGESWSGVGWHSAYSKTVQDKTMPNDWTGLGTTPYMEEAHSGNTSIRITHAPARKESYLLREWSGRSGRQGALLDTLKGQVSFWYKALAIEDANVWLGVLPMSADPWENTGAKRSGVTIPVEHAGDGLWHQVTVPYDYSGTETVKWIHVSCFIKGASADVLLDDIEILNVTPQPVTNGSFENTGTGGDPTKEIADLCHKHNIRYLAYFWGMREPPDVWNAHPQWKCVGRNGEKLPRFCPNNPEYRQFVKDRFAEIIRKCGVDGIFIDMHNISWNEGYCEHCVQKFREITGQTPPAVEDEAFDSPLWQEWVRFKYDSVVEAMLDYNRAIKATNPEAVLVSNSWNAWTYRHPGGGPRTGNTIRLAEVVDALLEELGWYDLDGSLFAFPARFNFMSWHLAGLNKERPAHMWGHPTEWGGGGSTQSIEARIRVMTMITNGAVAAQSVPSRTVMAEYMDDIASREAYLRRAHLFPWCGLVVSEKTEFWYGKDAPVDRYIKGVYGAFQMMLENHLPVSLVTDRELELGKLEKYRVLLIPNCAVMSTGEVATVREFVKNGGGVVATYETSRYDGNGWVRSNLGLGNLFGVTETVDTFDNRKAYHLGPPSGRSASLLMSPGHRWHDDPIIHGRMQRVSLASDPRSLTRALPMQTHALLVKSEQGTLDMQTKTWAPENSANTGNLTSSQKRRLPKNTTSTNWPGVIENTYGKGKVIYIPADLSWAFFRYGHDYLGRIMELAVRDAASEPPPVEVNAPSTVQTMTHQQGNRLVVHLLNDISSFGRSGTVRGESLYIRREVIPVHDIRVTFRDHSLKTFRLIPDNIELIPEETPAGWTVTVPRVDIHAMVVAE